MQCFDNRCLKQPKILGWQSFTHPIHSFSIQEVLKVLLMPFIINTSFRDSQLQDFKWIFSLATFPSISEEKDPFFLSTVILSVITTASSPAVGSFPEKSGAYIYTSFLEENKIKVTLCSHLIPSLDRTPVPFAVTNSLKEK